MEHADTKRSNTVHSGMERSNTNHSAMERSDTNLSAMERLGKSPLSDRMAYFSELLSCGQALYCWELTPELEILRSNCPQEDIFFSFLSLGDCEDYLAAHIASGSLLPLVLSDSLGLTWIAAFEGDGSDVRRVHMIGPAFNSDTSSRQLDQSLTAHYPPSMSRRLLEDIRLLPIISLPA